MYHFNVKNFYDISIKKQQLFEDRLRLEENEVL